MKVLLIIVPIIGIVLGIVAIVSPKTAWYLQEGWKYKNVEPSELRLFMVRIGGVAGVIGFLVFIFFAQSMFRGMPTGFP